MIATRAQKRRPCLGIGIPYEVQKISDASRRRLHIQRREEHLGEIHPRSEVTLESCRTESQAGLTFFWGGGVSAMGQKSGRKTSVLNDSHPFIILLNNFKMALMHSIGCTYFRLRHQTISSNSHHDC